MQKTEEQLTQQWISCKHLVVFWTPDLSRITHKIILISCTRQFEAKSVTIHLLNLKVTEMYRYTQVFFLFFSFIFFHILLSLLFFFFFLFFWYKHCCHCCFYLQQHLVQLWKWNFLDGSVTNASAVKSNNNVCTVDACVGCIELYILYI